MDVNYLITRSKFVQVSQSLGEMTHRVVALDTSADSVSAVSLKAKARKTFEEFLRTSDKYNGFLAFAAQRVGPLP